MAKSKPATHADAVVRATGCSPADVPELDELARASGHRVGEIRPTQFDKIYRAMYEALREIRAEASLS